MAIVSFHDGMIIGGSRSGASCTGSCNLISGNGTGVSASRSGGESESIVQGNTIGSNGSDLAEVPNDIRVQGFGVQVAGPSPAAFGDQAPPPPNGDGIRGVTCGPHS